MTAKPPPGKGGKPFLGEDDLMSELDAWDATFDALHEASPAASQNELAAAAPVMDWPEPVPEAIDPTTLSRPAPMASYDDDDDVPVAQVDDDDQAMTLDGSLELASSEEGRDTLDTYSRAQSASQIQTIDADPRETDFSDVGASGRPQTLGDMLGPASDQTQISNDRVEKARNVSRQERAATPRPIDDDEVFTSASRPTRAPADPNHKDDDEVAPPPMPERRTAAIVRRVTAPQGSTSNRDITPAGGIAVAQFAEQTRVIHTDEIEARAAASKRSMPVMPSIDEDAYDDIEIDSKSDDPVEVEAAPSQRRTAHVVRRTDAPTRPPLSSPTSSGSQATSSRAARPTAGPVIEMEMADETPLSKPDLAPGSENDFSDVALAVGAGDDPLAFELDVPRARTVPPGPPPGPKTPPPLRAASPVLDLSDLDDNDAPKTLIASPDSDLVQASRGHQMSRDDDDAFADESAPAMQTMIAPPNSDLVHASRRYAAPDLSDDEEAGPRTLLEAPRAEAPRAEDQRLRDAESARPPALADFYPRVKTPTSVPPLGVIEEIERSGAIAGMPRAVGRISTPLPPARDGAGEREPILDIDQLGRNWPEQAPPLSTAALDENAAAALLVYEREVSTLDDSATSSALRIEAGRLCERLADLERARVHYDAALLADPRATGALRGLRRIARAGGDLAEVTRHLDTEIAVAGALERRPLGHYRIDLLMASGDQDLARVAVGEMLDSAPGDIRALLAQLELAFLDGRADEFGVALEQIAAAVTDHELRAAVQSARGILAAHHNDTTAAATWFTAAAESDPHAIAARLGAVRHAAAHANGSGAARALLDVARQVESSDPITTAAAAIRAQQWAPPPGNPATPEMDVELAAMAGALATAAAPSDPLVARLAAEGASGDAAAAAFAHWARTTTAPAERAYAAARAAELDTAQAAELWAITLAQDPDDDYAAAQLRTSHVAVEATQAAIDVDLAIAADPERDRARLRAAYGLMAQGQLDGAIDVLAQGRAARPGSLALVEALGEAHAAAGKWTERAELFAELAREPGEQLDTEVAKLRSAIAWEEAVGAAAATDGVANDEMQRLTAAALAAWDAVLEHNAHDPAAHAAAIVLANRLGDRDVMGEVLSRAQAAEKQLSQPSIIAAGSLAFRRARLVADDPDRAESILRDIQPIEDPRRTVALILAAARTGELGDAAAALEERANQLDGLRASTEVATLRLRAAQLSLDAGDAARATRLLQLVETALPTLGVVPDLLAAARRRAGDSTDRRKTWKGDRPAARGQS